MSARFIYDRCEFFILNFYDVLICHQPSGFLMVLVNGTLCAQLHHLRDAQWDVSDYHLELELVEKKSYRPNSRELVFTGTGPWARIWGCVRDTSPWTSFREYQFPWIWSITFFLRHICCWWFVVSIADMYIYQRHENKSNHACNNTDIEAIHGNWYITGTGPRARRQVRWPRPP